MSISRLIELDAIDTAAFEGSAKAISILLNAGLITKENASEELAELQSVLKKYIRKINNITKGQSK